MFKAVTHNVSVSVVPRYLAPESTPEENHYVWSYTVQIENNSGEALQLMSRHWKIVDGFGRLHEVRGDGVIGEQPVINDGGMFEYTSGTPLETPDGFMSGSYTMQRLNGTVFDIEIPAFSLDMPRHARRMH